MSSSSSEDEPELETLDISNDQYYAVQDKRRPYRFTSYRKNATTQFKLPDDKLRDIPNYGSSSINHSLPAYDLWKPFFPTWMDEKKFSNFHRPKLRHYNTGPQAKSPYGMFKEFPIKSLSRNIFKYQRRLRNRVIRAIDNGSTREEIINRILLITEAKDLSAKHGELFLFEYSEEYPPVLSQIGMASNIKNYNLSSYDDKSKQTFSKGVIRSPSVNVQSTGFQQLNGGKEFQVKGTLNRIGIDVKLSSSSKLKRPIYFSPLKPNTTLQMIENNLYRAPIYEHQVPSCDFLVIRTRNSFYIRPVKTIFTVGQTMPLLTIPKPTERDIYKFRLNLSNYYTHLLFKESTTEPPSIKLEALGKLFPDYSKINLSKRITNNGAKPGHHNQERVIFRGRSTYGLISKYDLRRLLTPESYCLNMTCLAARERLRALNYTETMIMPMSDAEPETEVLASPWNVSKAVADTMLGRCYLDFKRHLIDPTGPQRAGFSCVAWSKSPTEEEQNKTLRESAKTTQIDRRQSGPPSLPLQKNPLLHKIQREKLERLAVYQKEAQLISEVQSKVLSSNEVISSSEDDGEDHDADENSFEMEAFDQELNDLDRLVIGGRSVCQLNHEKEEQERLKMMKEFRLSNQQHATGDTTSNMIIRSNDNNNTVSDPQLGSNSFDLAALRHRILKITRTYNTPEGQIQRIEIVREPRVIARYVKEKGGSLSYSSIENGGDVIAAHDRGNNMDSFYSTKSLDSSAERPRKRLGPKELCRAEGTILTISKKVLQDTRKLRRRSAPMAR